MFSSYFGILHMHYMPYWQCPEQLSDIYQQQLYLPYGHQSSSQLEHQDPQQHQNDPQEQTYQNATHPETTRNWMVAKCTDGNSDSEFTKSDETKSQSANCEIKFSIERILSEDKTANKKQNICVNEKYYKEQGAFQCAEKNVKPEETEELNDMLHYQWLHCTRYKPPKLQRIHKKECSKKRKLSRNPRVPFTQHQVATLERKFEQKHYLSSMDVEEISMALHLTDTRVKIWFQNRRARERKVKNAKQSDAQDHIHSQIQQDSDIVNAPSSSGFDSTTQHNQLQHNKSLQETVDIINFQDVLKERPLAYTPV